MKRSVALLSITSHSALAVSSARRQMRCSFESLEGFAKQLLYIGLRKGDFGAGMHVGEFIYPCCVNLDAISALRSSIQRS